MEKPRPDVKLLPGEGARKGMKDKFTGKKKEIPFLLLNQTLFLSIPVINLIYFTAYYSMLSEDLYIQD